MKKFFREFKEFINKGNIIDLAIAFILGAAFSAIVKSLANDIISALISSIFKKNSLSNLSVMLNGAEIKYGAFLQAVIDFLIIAFVLFLIVKFLMKAKRIALYNKVMSEEIQKKLDNDEELNAKELKWMDKMKKKDYKHIPIKREKPIPEPTENEKIIALLEQINESLKKSKEKVK